MSGVFEGGPEFRLLRVTPDREDVLFESGATLFSDLALSPDDKRLAFVERAIDTDVWLTPFSPAAR